ncbi:hypothetical protein CBS101457_000221 [Exobasidium rhododendri]|nr:hypothetical protein CBS101457_000221 [Exobasidium rhododendri]
MDDGGWKSHVGKIRTKPNPKERHGRGRFDGEAQTSRLDHNYSLGRDHGALTSRLTTQPSMHHGMQSDNYDRGPLPSEDPSSNRNLSIQGSFPAPMNSPYTISEQHETPYAGMATPFGMPHGMSESFIPSSGVSPHGNYGYNQHPSMHDPRYWPETPFSQSYPTDGGGSSFAYPAFANLDIYRPGSFPRHNHGPTPYMPLEDINDGDGEEDPPSYDNDISIAQQQHRQDFIPEQQRPDLSSYNINIGYNWMDIDELCWGMVDDDTRASIITEISKRTCSKKQDLVHKMEKRLTPLIAIKLLTGEESYIDEAVTALYGARYKALCGTWKKYLNDEQAEILVQQLQRACNREPVFVRYQLRHLKVSPEQAYHLYTTTDHERREYAVSIRLAAPRQLANYRDTNIISDADAYFRPWNVGTTHEQREAITATVRKVCECQSTWARVLLTNSNIRIEDRFGLEILRRYAEEGAEKTKEYIYAMTKMKPKCRGE